MERFAGVSSLQRRGRMQLVLCLCVLLFSITVTLGQHPKPPGITTADQQSNQPVEAPMGPQNKKVDLDQVRQEADEMKRLAEGVPASIEQVAKNQYPKDLNDNLKRIERLAKHMRT